MTALKTDRRSALKLGLAGAAFGLAAPQIMVRAASAQTAMPETPNAGFFRVRLGEFEVTTLLDGGRTIEGVAETFGQNQPAEDVAAVLQQHYLPADRWYNTFTPTLVNTGSELVLFDTGLGEGARSGGMGLARSRLEASGYSPEDVSVVVLTHFHGDHIGGVMEGDQPAYPNARYVTGQVEYDFWTAEERLSGPTEQAAQAVRQRIVPLAEKMTFLEDGGDVVPGIVGMPAYGHTPGHMIFVLESDGRQLVLTADTANHYLVSLQRPDWHVRFDMDKEAGAETRSRVLDMLATDKLPFIGYHMPAPSIGFVERLETGYRYVPHSYQLTL